MADAAPLAGPADEPPVTEPGPTAAPLPGPLGGLPVIWDPACLAHEPGGERGA